MSLIDDVHDALTTIPGLLPAEDCCHFTASSTDWRERLTYAMRGIEDQEETIADLRHDLEREERYAAFEEKRANALADEVDDLKSERDSLNYDLLATQRKLKTLESTGARESATT